jgi:hypothetical protein
MDFLNATKRLMLTGLFADSMPADLGVSANPLKALRFDAPAQVSGCNYWSPRCHPW